MKTMSWKLVVFLFVFLFGSAPLFAAQSKLSGLSRISSEIRGVKNSAATGILFGSRYMSYESDSFSVGGAAYSGQISGNVTGSFSYGGLLIGYTHPVSDKTEIEFSLLGGGAGGFQGSTVGGGVVLEPSLATNFVLGKTVRICLNAGYAWIPSQTSFSGITVGLRFDFLLSQTVE